MKGKIFGLLGCFLFLCLFFTAGHGEASWQTEDVDKSGNVGIDPAIAVDIYCVPHISYYDQDNRDLKYAVRNPSWETEIVDSDGDVGEESGIAVDIFGNPHISSNHGASTNILVYATKSVGSWTILNFEQPQNYHVTSTSIDLDNYGYPHIAYNIQENSDDIDLVDYMVRYTYSVGSAWHVENIAPRGQDVFMAIDSAGNTHVSFRVEDQNAGNDVYRLTYAKRVSGAWTITTVDSTTDVGGDTGIAVDYNNNPHIVYRDYGNGAVRYAHYDGTSWNNQVVNAGGGANEGTKIAVDSSGNPHIVYAIDATEQLMYSILSEGSWSTEAIDLMGNPAIAIDLYDKPHVAHNHTWDFEDMLDEEYLRYSVKE